MRKLGLGFMAVLFGIWLVMGGMTSVYAQEAESDAFELEEITVTAQKRAESQQKVAIAMEVISAEELRMSGKNDLNEILSDAGSVIIQKASDGIRVSLRGISDDTNTFHGQSASMPTVAINMDGVYSNRKDVGSGLFDIERVEVLFGPQSTLYSSNSPGGIVNIETAKPKLDTYEASGTLEYGNYDLLHTEGMVNAPISDTLALRAAFTTSVHDGYYSNGGDSEDAKNARLRLLYKPSEMLSFLFTGELSKTAQGYGNGVNAFLDESDVDDPWESDLQIAAPIQATTKRLYGRMDWDLGFASLSMLPSYTTRDAAGIKIDDQVYQISTLDLVQESEEKSVELRLASSEDLFIKWIVGFNYYDSEEIYNEDDQNGVLYAHIKQGEEAFAAYANATYPITDKFRATAGIRYSKDDLMLEVEEVRGAVAAPEYAHELHDDSYNDPDYKIGFEYDMAENTMLYADYSTSYRVQSMAGTGVSAEGRPPELLKAYTAGIKNRFLDNKIQLNAAAFYYDYQNYACSDVLFVWAINDVLPIQYGGTWVPNSDEMDGDPNSSSWGDGEMMGLDVSSTFLITPDDILDMSVSYLKSEWSDLTFDYHYDYAAVFDWPPPVAGSATPIGVVPAETVTYNGLPMTASPEWTINVSYSHEFNLWNGGNLQAKVDGQYKSDYRLSWRSDDYPLNNQEAFTIYNANLTYNSPDGNWSLSVYGRNLSNYAEKRSYFGNPLFQTNVGNPRTYGAVLSARF